MKEQSVQLLMECNSGCKMAVSSMNQILDYVKDEKLRRIIGVYLEKHQALEEKSSHLLDSYNAAEKEPGKMATAFSWVTTEFKMMLENDSSQAAKIMMNGCNMGIQSISGFANEYSDASIESKAVAKELVKMEEDFMKELKAFL